MKNMGTADLGNCTVTNFADAACPASAEPTEASSPVAESVNPNNSGHHKTLTAKAKDVGRACRLSR